MNFKKYCYIYYNFIPNKSPYYLNTIKDIKIIFKFIELEKELKEYGIFKASTLDIVFGLNMIRFDNEELRCYSDLRSNSEFYLKFFNYLFPKLNKLTELYIENDFKLVEEILINPPKNLKKLSLICLEMNNKFLSKIGDTVYTGDLSGIENIPNNIKTIYLDCFEYFDFELEDIRKKIPRGVKLILSGIDLCITKN